MGDTFDSPPDVENYSDEEVGEAGDSKEQLGDLPNGVKQEPVENGNHPSEGEKTLIPLVKVRDLMKEHCVPEWLLGLVFWDNTKASSGVFVVGTTMLIMLSSLSFISVFAYSALSVLLSVWALKMYSSVQATLNSKEVDHPLQQWLQCDISITPEKVSKLTDRVGPPLEATLEKIRAVILFQNTLNTFKVIVLMYALTYVGAVMNFLTLVFVLFLGTFTAPFIYEKKQKEINKFWSLTISKACEVANKAWKRLEPKIKDCYGKLPPAVKNPLSKFLKLESQKID